MCDNWYRNGNTNPQYIVGIEWKDGFKKCRNERFLYRYSCITSEKVDRYVLPGDETRFESDIIEHASSYNFSVSVFIIASSIAVSVCRNSVLMLLSVVSILCCDCDVVVVLFVQPSPETWFSLSII